jgi:hypothetical protein
MRTGTRRLAGLGLACAAAAVALAAPATAAVLPHDPAVRAHLHGTDPAAQVGAPARATSVSAWDWAQFGYGAAGGVVLFAAGAAGVVVRQHQHLPHHA